MTQRGRGALEVKKSLNPFMQTATAEYGMRVRDSVDWNRPAINPEEMNLPPPQNEDSGNFMFLYTRESDTVGGRLPVPKHSLAYEPKSKGDLLREKRDRLRALSDTVKREVDHEAIAKAKQDNIDACISSWKPCTKDEDPRYTTSGNEIGIKRPTIATFVAERAFRSGGFSKGFVNVKPESSALNTSLTKSTVHPKLDPQFI